MFFDTQKAGMAKRISAWLLDIILLAVAATGFAVVVSMAVGFDKTSDKLEEYYYHYESEYGINLGITEEESAALTPEEEAKYYKAFEAMDADEDLIKTYRLTVNLSLVILSLAILLAYLLTEFAVPLFFGNGQTIGKKIFGLCLMQKDQTKLKPLALAVRTLLGKYAVETMIPALMMVMLLGGMIGSTATMAIGLLLAIQILVMYRSPVNAAIHDVFAATVVVDMKSQKIFDDLKAKEEYKIRMEKGL